MRSLQEKVREFSERHGLDCPVETRILDLMSEVGELSKEIIKATNYGRGAIKENKAIQEEMGDVVFSLLMLANQVGIDLETALDEALEKYEHRIREKGDCSSGR